MSSLLIALLIFLGSTQLSSGCENAYEPTLGEISTLLKQGNAILVQPIEEPPLETLEKNQICKKNNFLAKKAAGEARNSFSFRYWGCQEDRDWMEAIRTEFCDGSQAKDQPPKITREFLDSLKIPENFFFSFDGAAGFNSQKAIKHDPNIVNLDGSERPDLRAGLFVAGPEMLTQAKLAAQERRTESRYYAGSGFQFSENYKVATDCARHIDGYLDLLEDAISTQGYQEFKPPVFVGLGYSNGGVDVINFQNYMGEHMKRPVDVAVTVDPVAKALFYHPGKLFTYIGEAHEDTGVFLNYYQRIDRNSLGGTVDTGIFGDVYLGFKFKGRPVKDADLNLELDQSNSEAFAFWDGHAAHIIIARNEDIWRKFREELEKVHQQR